MSVLICPRCADQPLEAVVRSGIETDRCPRGRGLWLDQGEMDKLASPSPLIDGAPIPADQYDQEEVVGSSSR